MRSWVQTHTGVAFDLLEPRAEDVVAEDIIFSLAHQARYNGHAGHYTVLHHSLVAYDAAMRMGFNKDVQREVLLHDAAEAYIGDIVSPLKKLLADQIKPIEARILKAIHESFNITPQYGTQVHAIDMGCLIAESEVFFPNKPRSWDLSEAAYARYTEAALPSLRDFVYRQRHGSINLRDDVRALHRTMQHLFPWKVF